MQKSALDRPSRSSIFGLRSPILLRSELASCVSRDLRPYSLRGLAFAFVVLCWPGDAQIIAHKTIIVISKRRRKSDAIAVPSSSPSSSSGSSSGQLCGLSHRKADWPHSEIELGTSNSQRSQLGAGRWAGYRMLELELDLDSGWDFYLWPVNATSSGPRPKRKETKANTFIFQTTPK